MNLIFVSSEAEEQTNRMGNKVEENTRLVCQSNGQANIPRCAVRPGRTTRDTFKNNFPDRAVHRGGMRLIDAEGLTVGGAVVCLVFGERVIEPTNGNV